MATGTPSNSIFQKLHEHRGMIFPLAFVGMLVVLLVPLPTPVLDFLLVFNITVSVIVLVTAVHVKSPLEFAVFPSLLLALTLFRLVLNVATTRLILTAADRTPDAQAALHGAGEVVMAFGKFVAGNSLAVGVIVFVIIFVIQFVVITKGSSRIAEVAARFTLDAMPGKQMAIDADLSAGHIDEATARQRREAVGREADFYAAMDGANKFVRGDAIAAVIITFINILGGLYVGMIQHKWEPGACLELYTMLTIGDGLVSQVPAFVVSIAAGLIVTRGGSGGKTNLGEDVLAQVFARPKALMIAAAFLMLMAFTGLPKGPVVVLACCCGGLAWVLTTGERKAAREAAESERERIEIDRAAAPETVQSLLDVDAMSLEFGRGLVPLADPACVGGGLMARIESIRREVAVELGIIVPSVAVRKNERLDVNDYVIRIKGQVVARGEAYPGQSLAIDNGSASGPLCGGTLTKEPAFGLPAYWVTESERADAERLRYAVVEAADTLTIHLTEVIKAHAHELLTRQEVKGLLDNLRARAPAVVDEVVPALVKPGELQKVLQNLLRERVPVRDLETILETLGDWAPRTKDIDLLTAYVRAAMARTICKHLVDAGDRLWCLTLDPSLEDLVSGHLERSAGSTLPPQTAERVVKRLAEKAAELTQDGRPGVVLCSPQVRSALRRVIEAGLPHVAVLGYNEVVPEVAVEAVAMVGLED
jgi:flagellar biosynthesis protein FlhA